MSTIGRGTRDFIVTYTGKRFYPLAPDLDDICIEDVAHALSMQCRFTGHVSDFYSVADHCLWVSVIAAELGHPEDALWGLLHDASEAYLHDIASPIKRQDAFALYRGAESTLEDLIFAKFGLHGPRPPSVKWADKIMVTTEAQHLMPHLPGVQYSDMDALAPGRFFVRTQQMAEIDYLIRFSQLMEQRVPHVAK
jgi:uncharacterized protein